jgi:two-component system, cell cycle response regulator
MTRVLAVDDSRAIRTMVSKQILELGFECDEAEDGEQGLLKLAENRYDLVVLDVTMPVLDGPGMLEKMRARGDRTPVLMLTSESKTSIVAFCMKQGIDDYIIKPFKAEELRAKVQKCIKPVGLPAGMGGGAPMPAAMSGPSNDGAKQYADVLVVDDMENVHKKLRQMLPPHVSMNAVLSAQHALTMCRDRVYRVVLVDTEMTEIDTRSLVTQLRALQPTATLLGMMLKTAKDPAGAARQMGYDGVFTKPFDQERIEDLLLQYFDKQDVLSCENNVLKALPFIGKDDRRERYFRRLSDLSSSSLENIAAACFEWVILDLRDAPTEPKRLTSLVMGVADGARKVGLTTRIVGLPDHQKMFAGFAETASIPFFESLDQAALEA